MISDYSLVMAALVGLASAHGVITSPQPRVPGTAMAAACGQQVYNNQKSDDAGNIQGMLQVANNQPDYKAAACGIWLCKGYQFADNKANVQSFTPGQTLNMKFDIRAPHTGSANVSIVDTASNKVIGQPLASWAVFASNSKPISANETSFSVKIPSDLGGQCATAGACVIQHFWDAPDIKQTYESCVDFTMGGAGSDAGQAGASGSSNAAPSSSPGAAIAGQTTLATSVVAKAVNTAPDARASSVSSGGAHGGCDR